MATAGGDEAGDKDTVRSLAMPGAFASPPNCSFRFFDFVLMSAPLSAPIVAAAAADDDDPPLDGGWSIVFLLAQDVSLSLSVRSFTYYCAVGTAHSPLYRPRNCSGACTIA